jgi:hypothetical protein
VPLAHAEIAIRRGPACFKSRNIMLGDLHLPTDEMEHALHRERVAALLAAGYDAVAVVHTAAGRLSEADR